MSDDAVPEEAIRAAARADGITHLSTGIAIVRDGKVLVVRREPDDFLGGYFELPGGGVDPGETLAEAVKREALEEIGLHVSKILAVFPGFEYTTPNKPKVRQINVLVEAVGYNIKLSAEHDYFEWVDLARLGELPITPEIKTCIEAALNKVAELAAG